MTSKSHTDHGVLEATRTKTRKPRLYKVSLLNDDYTTMEFVVHDLESIFNKAPAEAHGIMMQVQTQGRGVCGGYTYEVAETKIAKTQELAQREGFPLQAALEEE